MPGGQQAESPLGRAALAEDPQGKGGEVNEAPGGGQAGESATGADPAASRRKRGWAL